LWDIVGELWARVRRVVGARAGWACAPLWGPNKSARGPAIAALEATLLGVYRGHRELRRPQRGRVRASVARGPSVRVLQSLESQESCRVAQGLRYAPRWLKFKTNNTLNFKSNYDKCQRLDQNRCCTPPVRRLQTQQLTNGSQISVPPSVETHGVRGGS